MGVEIAEVHEMLNDLAGEIEVLQKEIKNIKYPLN